MKRRAWLFDLDGTLLPLDVDEFLPRYLGALARRAAEVTDPERFTQALLASTAAMVANRDPALTNAAVFWCEFRGHLGQATVDRLLPLIDAFYRHDFPRLGRAYRSSPWARRALAAVLDQGAALVLATNPLFPEVAIRERMRWAEVADLPFTLITSFEQMHFCKPAPAYYLEVLDRLGLPPEACVMVGNDVQEDIVPARAVGLSTYLVTDMAIDRSNQRELAHAGGSLRQLAEQLERGGGRC
jgi:FMN phosphatase YigB (HAD superfamily)